MTGDISRTRPSRSGLSAGGSAVHVDVTVQGSKAILRVSGELDLSSAPHLQKALDRVIDDDVRLLDVDLADVRFCDGQGLHVLLACRDRLQRGGGDLAVRSPCRSLQRLIEIFGLGDMVRDPETARGHG